MMLQAGLLAARVEVAQLIQQLRQAEDRLWRLQERNGELTRDLRQYKQALALANRENERKSAYLRKAKIVADYVNNTV
jgi:uncharacterized protein YhaN